ncbi:MAG: PP2C family protein-serine/threonine phosphatase [Firmicutes bacterium]|nr:PP2C family protein-serine/threonine phosphatase [Bacillota bacterium]
MPLKSIKDMTASEKKRHSLSAKMFRIIVVSCIILGVVVLAVGTMLYSLTLSKQYINEAFNLANQAYMSVTHGTDSVSLSKEVMRIYESLSEEERAGTGTWGYRANFSKFESDHEYDVLIHMLRQLLEHSEAYALYIAMYDGQNSRLVFMADPDTVNGMYPGDWEKVSEKEVKKFLSWDGEGVLYHISRTEDEGWLCTTGVPIKDEAGNICSFILADITLDDLVSGMKGYLLQISIVLLTVTALMAFLLTRRMQRTVIEPVNSIAEAAKSYVADKRSGITDKDHFQTLNIRTGDEIENLSLVMADMERDLTEIETDLTVATAQNERINTELSLATRLQSAFIPHTFPPFPDRTEFNIYASMDPAKAVGGDFYDYFLIDQDHLGLLIADVSGKGIPAALFMMVSKIILQSCAMLGKSVSEILEKTNQAICSNNEEQMFLTVWVGILEISTGKLKASNAGHEYPMIKAPGGDYEMLKDKHGFVIGGMEESVYTEYELLLEPGSKIFLYTDGLPEATDSNGKMFGTERILEVLNSDREAGPEKVLGKMSKAVDGFVKDAEQFDDLTMLCFEYKGKD